VLDAAQPELFIPIHGEYRHLALHARLAVDSGVPQTNVIILEDGHPVTMTPGSFRLEAAVPVESVMVDGKGVGDVGRLVLKERRLLGGDGLVIVVLVFAEETGEVLHGPEMISRGFVFEQHFSHLLEDAKCLVLDQLETMDTYDLAKLQERIRSSLRRFFRDVLGRDPVVMPIVTEV
jgi:ribonuclease J